MIEVGVIAESLIGLRTIACKPEAWKILLSGTYSRRTAVITYLFDNRQHPRLCIVISVGPNTEINLLIESILPISGHQPEQRVVWGLRHIVRQKGCGRRRCHMVCDGGKSDFGG